MTRGKARWSSKAERARMPLPAERPAQPRTDGEYASVDGLHRVAFLPGGVAEIDGEAATWRVAADVVRLASASWDAEGALGVDTLQLLSSPGGDHHRREAWQLVFTPRG